MRRNTLESPLMTGQIQHVQVMALSERFKLLHDYSETIYSRKFLAFGKLLVRHCLAPAHKIGVRFLYQIPLCQLLTFHTALIGDLSTETAQDIIDCLTVLQVVLPNVSSSLHEQLSSLLLPLLDILRAPLSILRNVAAKTLAVMCEVMPSFGMLFVIENLLSLFGDAVSEANRSGAMEAIHCR
jgi:hypothetical protein